MGPFELEGRLYCTQHWANATLPRTLFGRSITFMANRPVMAVTSATDAENEVSTRSSYGVGPGTS